MAIRIKHLWIDTKRGKDQQFVDELDDLCKKLAKDGKDYSFQWIGEG